MRWVREALTRLPLRWVFEVFYLSSSDPWQYWRSSFENQRYDAAIGLLRGRSRQSMLEVGCSVGAFTGRLLALAPARVTALDISAVALRRARRALEPGPTRLDLACIDVFREAPPQPPYDLVVAMDVLGYTDDLAVLRATRDRLLDALTPDGMVLLGNTRLKAHDGEGFEPFASGFPRLGANAIFDCFAERAERLDGTVEARYRLDLLSVNRRG